MGKNLNRLLEEGRKIQVFTTETGTQTALSVDPQQDVTFFIKAGASDSIDLEINLDPDQNGTWHTLLSGIAENTLETLDGPVAAMRLNIVTNVSNDIEFELLKNFRGG